MVTFPPSSPSFDFRSPVNPVNLDQWSHAFSDLVVTFFLSFNLRWVRFSLVCFHFVTYQIKSNVGLSQIERLMPSFRAGVFKGGCKIHLFFFKWSSPPPKDVTKVDDGYLGRIQLFFKTRFWLWIFFLILLIDIWNFSSSFLRLLPLFYTAIN